MPKIQVRRRSPIRLECERLGFPKFRLKSERRPSAGEDMLCTWRVVAPFKAATFRSRSRRDEDHYAIVHPSPKQRGRWQVSFFDAEGPYSDTITDSPEEALGILPHYLWRIERIE